MELDVDQVERSFAAISPRLDELTLLFYTDLFETHPELKPLFGSVDLVRQRRKLAAMLTLIVTNLSRMDVLVSALRALGERHIAYRATPESYAWTEASLLRALARVAGDAWDEPTRRAWEAAIGLVTAEMRAGADHATEANGTSTSQDDDLDLLMEIASNPSLSFQQNSLFSSYVDKKKSDHEMDLARSIQLSLIPPVFPEVPGYGFAATYEPAQQVGGDYYDWVHTGQGCLCFLFGDVSGKGVPGALIMARLAGAARAMLTVQKYPADVLTSLNAHMCDRMPSGRFVTLACVGLKPDEHRFAIASAGHLPAVQRSASGNTEFIGQGHTGIPIGIDATATYEAFEGTLEPGDTLVLYTDGANEAMGADNELYGMDRVLTSIAAAPDADAVGQALRDDVRTYAGGRPPNDDLTILTITRRGDAG
jgi:serine phosphatase RsbU (regulator of sigma subunit)